MFVATILLTVLVVLVLITYMMQQRDKLGEHYESSQEAMGNVVCHCGFIYVPRSGAKRKGGMTHTVRLCFPEREEIKNEKSQGKDDMS